MNGDIEKMMDILSKMLIKINLEDAPYSIQLSQQMIKFHEIEEPNINAAIENKNEEICKQIFDIVKKANDELEKLFEEKED